MRNADQVRRETVLVTDPARLRCKRGSAQTRYLRERPFSQLRTTFGVVLACPGVAWYCAGLRNKSGTRQARRSCERLSIAAWRRGLGKTRLHQAPTDCMMRGTDRNQALGAQCSPCDRVSNPWPPVSRLHDVRATARTGWMTASEAEGLGKALGRELRARLVVRSLPARRGPSGWLAPPPNPLIAVYASQKHPPWNLVRATTV